MSRQEIIWHPDDENGTDVPAAASYALTHASSLPSTALDAVFGIYGIAPTRIPSATTTDALAHIAALESTGRRHTVNVAAAQTSAELLAAKTAQRAFLGNFGN